MPGLHFISILLLIPQSLSYFEASSPRPLGHPLIHSWAVDSIPYTQISLFFLPPTLSNLSYDSIFVSFASSLGTCGQRDCFWSTLDFFVDLERSARVYQSRMSKDASKVDRMTMKEDVSRNLWIRNGFDIDCVQSRSRQPPRYGLYSFGGTSACLHDFSYVSLNSITP